MWQIEKTGVGILNAQKFDTLVSGVILLPQKI